MSIFEYDAELHMKMEREEAFEQVKRIYDIADEFAPEYDAEKIYEKLIK